MGHVYFTDEQREFIASTLYYYHSRYLMSPRDKVLYNKILSNLGSPKSTGSPWNGYYPYIYGDLEKDLHKGKFGSLEDYNKAVEKGTSKHGVKMAKYCWFVETEVPPYHEKRVLAR